MAFTASVSSLRCTRFAVPRLARSMAGHSKWHNIRHKKGRNDAARSKIVSALL